MSELVDIANPKSGGGRTSKIWRDMQTQLQSRLGPVEFLLTKRSGHATELARQAVKDGVKLVISVGGDGTINEIVNGFFEDGRQINPDVEIGLLNSGTGGDFRKPFGLPENWEDGIERIAQGSARSVDLGLATYINDQGREEKRYFNNITSFGASGKIARRVNRATISKWLGGRFSYLFHTYVSTLTMRNDPVRLKIDDHFDEEMDIALVAVAICPWFGGGMKIAPNAKVDDGLFDIIILHDLTVMQMIKYSPRLYDGTHLELPNAMEVRGKRLSVEMLGKRPVFMELDGESPARLNASFEILPQALKVRV